MAAALGLHQPSSGAEPLRDEPPDAAAEEHSQPTLGGKRGGIGYTVLPRYREGFLVGRAAGILEEPLRGACHSL